MNWLQYPVSIAAFLVALGGAGWLGWKASEPTVEPSPLFSCITPYHHDGDAIRCRGKGRSSRLYAIDTPEMPGSCRVGRDCTPGDPFAARDHLASLTSGKAVTCRLVDADERKAGFQEADRYGRPVLQCFAGTVDLSCAMVRDGFAVERYGDLRCM